MLTVAQRGEFTTEAQRAQRKAGERVHHGDTEARRQAGWGKNRSEMRVRDDADWFWMTRESVGLDATA